MTFPEKNKAEKNLKSASVVVVVPVHSARPTPNELVSFEQCFRIFSARAIKVLAPANLNLEAYKEKVADFEVVYIDPKWQSSIAAYNKLKISRYFYRLFQGYEYLLTYELDCFVFRDELDYWCSQGYDYIGAPWFEGFSTPRDGAKLSGVGNSGFSLRKVRTIQKILASIYYRDPGEYGNAFNTLKATIKYPYRWLCNQMGENHTLQQSCGLHEDSFFGRFVPRHYPAFHLAPVDEALKFSFEVKPDVLFRMNDNQLPMGCHAWWRYDLAFWMPYIESFGYQVQTA